MRFVVCGEALIDLFPRPTAGDDAAGRHFRSLWEAQSAGGPMNTAIALGRLDDQVSFLGRLSNDVYGAQLRAHLADNRVALDLAVDSDQATSLAVVSLDDAGKASYVFHFADTANFGWRPHELPALGESDWLHIASLATVIDPGASVLLDWARGCPGPVSYDINVRPTVISDPAAYWQLVLPWLEVCARPGGVVKASDDDIAFLAGGSGHRGDPVAVARAWVRELGLDRVVVTLGPHGAACVQRDGSVIRVPGCAVDVADTVGAGDTFSAGLIDALAAGADIEQALRRGVAASAVVVTRSGAQPPTRAELDAQTAAVPTAATATSK